MLRLLSVLLKDQDRAAQYTHSVLVKKKKFVLYVAIIAVRSEIHTKYVCMCPLWEECRNFEC